MFKAIQLNEATFDKAAEAVEYIDAIDLKNESAYHREIGMKSYYVIEINANGTHFLTVTSESYFQVNFEASESESTNDWFEVINH